MKRLLFLFSLTLLTSSLFAQVWTEDFNSYPDGTMNAPPKWTSLATDCDDGGNLNLGPNQSQWGVYAGQFTINDIEGAPCCAGGGGGAQNEWNSEVIDISNHCDISISVDVTGMGGMECNQPGAPVTGCQNTTPPDNSHDQVVMEYSLNGGGFIQFGYLCGDLGFGNYVSPVFNGNTVQIRIKPANKANAEFYYIDNIVVNGTTPTIPTFAPIGPLCDSDPPVPLPLVSNEGITGTWDVGPTFNPAGQGGQIVTINFTPNPGVCAAPTTMMIQVDVSTPITLAPIPPVCNTDPPVILNSAPGGIPGTWSGIGVSGNTFNPAGLNGTYTLTFTPSPGNCATPATTNVIVNAPALPDLGTATLCESDPAFDLTNIQDPAYPTGSWSGQGVSGNFFNPGGLGGQTVNLTFVASGTCVLPAQTTIDVLAIATPVLDTDEICDDNGLYDLTQLEDPNYTAGTWSGDGVTGTDFDPTGLNGDIVLTFTSSEDCVAPETTIITVNVSATPTLATDEICENNGIYDLTDLEDVNYAGGTWSGDGVSGSNFDPTGLNGPVTLTYDPSTACVQITTTTIDVVQTQTPILDADELCDDNGIYDLTQIGDPNFISGTWSGQNVTGTNFDPTGLSGDIEITFTSDEACVEEVMTIITVNTFQTPVLGTDQICETDGLYDLTQLLDPNHPDGTWSGNGVNGNFFDPENNTGTINLDFTPNEDCVNNASTTIEVAIPEIPNLAVDTICENGGMFDLTLLNDPNFTTGTWSGTGVTGTEFDPAGNAGDNTLTFTSSENCVDATTTNVFVIMSETPMLESDQICEDEGIYNLNNLLDPNFTTGTWSGMGVSGNEFDPTGLNGDISLTFTSDAECANAATTTITVDTLVGPDLGTAAVCEEDGIFDLTALEDPAFPGGTWSGQNATGSDFDPTGLSGDITLTYTPAGDCTESSTTIVTVNAAPGFLNLTENCMPGDPTYTISFEITGGDPTSYMVDGVPVGGNIFTSGPINNGDAYNFEIDDMNGCGPVAVNGSFNCDCATNAGSMDFSNSPLEICDGNSFSVVHNQNENLDADDILVFILHDQPGTQLGTIIEVSNTVDFDFPSGIIFGQTYYISAVAGTDDGMGNIDLNDGCLSVSQGIPVYFYQLGVQLSAGGNVCENDCFDFNVSFTGTPPFQLIYSINTNQGNFQDTLDSDDNFSAFTVCPADYNVNSGDIEVASHSLNDINCDNFSQTADIQILTVDSIPTNNFTPTLCPGEVRIVNGTIYDENNPIGTELFTDGSSAGCDSIVEVNLGYFPPAEFMIQNTFCEGESIEVNGTTYDQNNPNGTEILVGMSQNGCDSTVQIDLTFNENPEFLLNPTLCRDESVIVNGNVYDFSNPTGSQTISGGSQHGCDSTVTIQLEFFDEVVFDLQPTVCEEDTVIINGVIYDINNPSGIEIFDGVTDNGCDSTVNISLNFHPMPTGELTGFYCDTEVFTINGNIYDINNPTGTENLENASYLGCDSTVEVSLTFIAPSEFTLTQTLCTNSFITVNGTIYDENNPTGTETLANASESGCDSIVFIDLSFANEVIFNLTDILCQEDSIEVNGTVYDFNNPTGSEIFENGSMLGCDSVVNISLSFYTSAEYFLTESLCDGSDVLVNGTVYDAGNPAGTEVLSGASFNGCDSTIHIDLSFISPGVNDFDSTICNNDFLIFNGNIYDINNFSGTEILTGANYQGCDSVINIELDFFQTAQFDLTGDYCVGESITVNGTVYDAANPSGFEVLADGSINGCDSVISVVLTFHPDESEDVNPVLCEGESIVVNGTVYDENNPSGTELIPGGTFYGCDSTININLTFLSDQTEEINQILPINQSITVNGTVYDVNNPTGTEVIPNGAFNGCDSIIIVTLEFFEELTIDIFSESPTCFGDENGFIQIDTIFGGSGMTYFVNLEGQPPLPFSDFPIIFDDLQSGLYVITVDDGSGQVETLEIIVPDATEIVVELGDDQTILLGGSTILDPQTNINPDSILWTPDTGLNCNNCSSVTASPGENTVYTVTIFDENGCSASDEIEVFVQKIRFVYLPNAFSPNDDGINDKFTVFGGPNVERVNTLQVFSRWGETLFKADDFAPNDVSFGWDGRFDGEKMGAGVYVFFTEILYTDGQTEIFKGDFVLMR